MIGSNCVHYYIFKWIWDNKIGNKYVELDLKENYKFQLGFMLSNFYSPLKNMKMCLCDLFEITDSVSRAPISKLRSVYK